MAASRLSIKALYPFLPEAKREFQSLGFDLDSFRSPSLKPIIERAYERVLDALKLGENVDPWKVADDSMTELASFPLAIILVAKAGDNFLQRRFALAEASIIQKRLMRELSESGGPDFVQEIARNVFRMDVEKEESPPYTFSVGLVDYLRSASEFNDPAWKLVNRVVERGRVYLEARELVRLLRNKVEEYIMENIKRAEREIGGLPDNLEDLVKKLKAQVPARGAGAPIIDSASIPEAWPPCVKSIYSKLTSGQSVSHFANFMIASFLLNTGASVEEVVSLYSQRSDFDERIARYQVEHIAGRRGSRTRYTTPSCGKIRTNGLCIEEGRLCGNVKSPLSYYRKRVRELKKIDKSKDEVGGERGEAGG